MMFLMITAICLSVKVNRCGCYLFCLDNSSEQKGENTSQEASNNRNKQEEVTVKKEITEQKPVEEADNRVKDHHASLPVFIQYCKQGLKFLSHKEIINCFYM